MSLTTFLIFTDLDGTLLDHDNYSFEAAAGTLQKLKAAGHFVIPNTSKTFAELSSFKQSAQLNTPFIFENGSAVAIPKDFFPWQPPETVEKENMWIKSFSPERSHWLSLIQQHGQHFYGMFKGFSQMSTEEVVSLTGLSHDAAHQAMQRQYGEPLHWNGDEYAKREFLHTMQAAGAKVLTGGRFTHICGDSDKGKAMLWLAQMFSRECEEQEFKTIALGDSQNDSAMLEAADIAVQIKSHSHPFPKIKKQQHLYQSTLYGPAGWSECLEKIVFNQE
ncbi:HAD-IIB family hydrolase [Planctobacterium marinum]|uniref:Mannosyl-3-phosphoglycerate phosphatase n=1 Tax=Planctobacterium marinum TaxID=1631968 RepID=A0AA48HRZ1_9ALTE|nr:mannosyl-3-phosphoglycerate phosphatase [Planctobacterium marinum]